eukprot:s3412_g2.t1
MTPQYWTSSENVPQRPNNPVEEFGFPLYSESVTAFGMQQLACSAVQKLSHGVLVQCTDCRFELLSSYFGRQLHAQDKISILFLAVLADLSCCASASPAASLAV